MFRGEVLGYLDVFQVFFTGILGGGGMTLDMSLQDSDLMVCFLTGGTGGTKVWDNNVLTANAIVSTESL